MITIYYVKGTKQGCSVFYSNDLSSALVEMIDLQISSTQALKMYAAHYHHSIEDSQRLLRRRYKFYQKVPVFIEKDRSLFFPTASALQWDCCWINYYAVRQIRKARHQSVVYFQEIGKKYQFSVRELINNAAKESKFEAIFDLDVRILRKQMDRCHKIVEDLQWKDMNELHKQN